MQRIVKANERFDDEKKETQSEIVEEPKEK